MGLSVVSNVIVRIVMDLQVELSILLNTQIGVFLYLPQTLLSMKETTQNWFNVS